MSSKKGEAKVPDKLKSEGKNEVVDSDAPNEHQVDSNDARKDIYSKVRDDRDRVVRENEEDMPDAKALREAADEAASTGEQMRFDTNRDTPELDEEPDPESGEPAPDTEYVAERVHDDEPDENENRTDPDLDVEDQALAGDEEAEDRPAPAWLDDAEVKDGRIRVQVNGEERWVPQGDIERAGGPVPYQKQVAANIAMIQATTDAKALREERQKLVQPEPPSSSEGEPPAKGAPEVTDERREAAMEAILNGTEDDFREVLNQIYQDGASAGQAPTKADTEASDTPTRNIEDVVIENHEQRWRGRLQEANRMLMSEYGDVVNDSHLRGIGEQKFNQLIADPANLGRDPVDLAYEAGDYARDVAKDIASRVKPTVDTSEDELEQRKRRKRVLPKQSQAHQRPVPKDPEKPKLSSAAEHVRRVQEQQGKFAKPGAKNVNPHRR